MPAAAERGVVVIHELFGRQPEIDRVVDRFAAAGYAAVGPDLFAGRSKPACMRRALATIATGIGHHPIAVALSWPLFHIRYDPAVAEDAWGKILGFFDRTL